MLTGHVLTESALVNVRLQCQPEVTLIRSRRTLQALDHTTWMPLKRP